MLDLTIQYIYIDGKFYNISLNILQHIVNFTGHDEFLVIEIVNGLSLCENVIVTCKE